MLLNALKHIIFGNGYEHPWVYPDEKGHCNNINCKDPYHPGFSRKCGIVGCDAAQAWNKFAERWEYVCSLETKK